MQMKSGCACLVKGRCFLPSSMARTLNRQALCILAVFSLRRRKRKNADSTRTARIALHGQLVWVYPEILAYGREWHYPRDPESKKPRGFFDFVGCNSFRSDRNDGRE